MLKIENFTKSINGKKILDHVSLEIGKGNLAILLGPSGVGKSTLLRALNNLEHIEQGSVSLHGIKVDLATINQAHAIGMVFQNFNLFEHVTVLQNITLALEQVLKKDTQIAQQEALALLQDFGLEAYAQNYPAQLSGGQKQRLAICRTLAMHPQVICMDEPTSALDPLLTKYVAETIEKLLKKGLSVIVATHDIGFLKQLDGTIYLMSNGKIVESTTNKEFHKNQDKYPALKAFIAET